MVGSIYIARHGERVDYVNAVWNDDADFPYDPPLSDDGVRHAEELGRRLARRVYKAGPNGQIDLILVSPFWRTLQTASGANMWLHAPMEAFSGVGEHISKSYFHEMPELEYNSLPASVVQDNFFKAQYKGQVPISRFPESHEAMVARARDAVKHITQEFCIKRNMNVVVVTHAAVMTEMVRALVGERDYDAKISSEGAVGYCASAKMELDQRSGAWYINYYHRGEKRRVLAHVYSYMQDRVMEVFKGHLKQKQKHEGERGRAASRTDRLRDRLAHHGGGVNVGGIPVLPPAGMGEGDDEYFNRQSPRPVVQNVYIGDGGEPVRSPTYAGGGYSPYGGRPSPTDPQLQPGRRSPYAMQDGRQSPHPAFDGRRSPFPVQDGRRSPYAPQDGRRSPHRSADGPPQFRPVSPARFPEDARMEYPYPDRPPGPYGAGRKSPIQHRPIYAYDIDEAAPAVMPPRRSFVRSPS